MGEAIDQCGNDAHLRDNSRAAERQHRRVAQDGVVLLECTVGPLGCRAEGMQLVITIGASRDFQDEPGVLSNREMS